MTATEQVQKIANTLEVDFRHIITGTAMFGAEGASFSLKGPHAEHGNTAAHDMALIAVLKELATGAGATPKEDNEDPGERLGQIAGSANGKLHYPRVGSPYLILEVPGGFYIRDADAEKLLRRLREIGSAVESVCGATE